MASAQSTQTSQVAAVVVKLAELEEDPHNARQVFDKAKLQALADSIKAQGIWQAPLARLLPSGRYRLIDGHRRCRAAKLAGLTEIRVDVVDLGDQAAAVAAATANLQREDLTPYEQARAFKAALDLGMQKKELCDQAGIVFNTLKARLQLLDLPEAVATRVDRNGFTAAHAKLVLPFASDPKVLAVAIDAMADPDGTVPTTDVAGARMVEKLTADKLVVNVTEASGLRYAYGPEKERLAKLVKETASFKVPGAGRYGGDAQLALASPAVLEAVKAAAKKEKELKAKRDASYGISRSKPLTEAERAKRAEAEQLEKDARARALTMRLQALLAKADKITSGHVADVFLERWHDDQTLAPLLDHLGIKDSGKDARGAVIKALGKLPIAKAIQVVMAHKVARAYEYDREETAVVQDVTGKKFSDWLSAAKVQLREEAKKAKVVAKPTDDKKPKPGKGTPKTAAKVKGKAKKPGKVSPAVAKALAKLEKAKPSKVVKGKQAALPSAAPVELDPSPSEVPAAEPVQVAS